MSNTDPGVAAPPRSSARQETVADIRVAFRLAFALAIVGALLGLVWSAWSPQRPAGLLFKGGQIEVLAEDESLVAADGRYLVLVTVAGVAAALLAWFLVSHRRGPIVMIGLAAGSAGGAALTELVGYLSGGGSYTGRPARLSDGTVQQVSVHLPLSLHMPWLVAVETVLVTLLYGLFVAFTAPDDLGRADPVRDEIRAHRQGTGEPDLVDAGRYPQDGWGHSDTARAVQQGDLPPQ